MLLLGPIGFTAPWVLAALVILPVLWILLRAVPPAPIRRRFPGVALLLGLKDDETEADKTPWWLLLLRTLAIAAVILGLAGPVLNPDRNETSGGALLVLEDGGWASARDWPRRIDRMTALIDSAARAGRRVAVVSLSDLPKDQPLFVAAADAAAGLPGLKPRAWEGDAAKAVEWLAGFEGDFDTHWFSDGLVRDGRDALLAALSERGEVTVVESPRPVLALRGSALADGALTVTALRASGQGATTADVVAHGPDPSGVERELGRAAAVFEDGAIETVATFDLPAELRNRVTRFEIEGQRTAGAVSLADDALRRREVALIAGRNDREGLELLSPLHYLRQALAPTADIISGSVGTVIPANPDVLILADVARVTPEEQAQLLEWIEAGGLLVRFAGPRLAASTTGRTEDDPLLPVRLREGGRTVGGAMSWGEARTLAPFAEGSPFRGLVIPDEVTVSAQVLAEPGPDLADRTIATLADGTPLVTRRQQGEGQVVLVHTTANAEWSSLALSGLFVQMLERLAVSTRPARPSAADLAGTTWVPEDLLDGFGGTSTVEAGTLPGVPGETMALAQPSAELPPGLYAGEDRRMAVNAVAPDRSIIAMEWPENVRIEGLSVTAETPLKGPLLALALGLALLDLPAAMWLSGKLPGLPRRRRTAALIVSAVALTMLSGAPDARAQDLPAPESPRQMALDDALALKATTSVVLAHVLTGDAELDRVASAGLLGLSDQLYGRTSVEPAMPIGIDLERDDLAFFPFLYWPISEVQKQPSDAAYAKLNEYLRSGGMILFDTRDADIADFGGSTPTGRKLQELAAPLDIPPLAPMPQDHVLTRSFYLLQDFPGRHLGRAIWVEAAPADAELAEGMPFRNLNDGVTPVVIGGNDWASAWAVDESGIAMFPVGRGFAGERQREISYRFGVNLIMHVLTGNYKSDQVHVPALLERLGQ
ncbi:MAG: DUF4159 domain-containing protein [Paracoccaceae bacterium]